MQIAPGVLLGDKFCAWDASKLMETHGVTHVLNCADTSAKGPIDHESLGLRYMQLDADDDVTYDMIGATWPRRPLSSARRARSPACASSTATPASTAAAPSPLRTF